MNSALKTSDMSWIDDTFLNNNEVSECKLGPFEHAQSMSKQPTRSAYIGDSINYLFYLLFPSLGSRYRPRKEQYILTTYAIDVYQ